MNDRDELIRRRAYAIWENEGRPEGQDQRHWAQASREMGGLRPDPASESEPGAGLPDLPSTIPQEKPRRRVDRP